MYCEIHGGNCDGTCAPLEIGQTYYNWDDGKYYSYQGKGWVDGEYVLLRDESSFENLVDQIRNGGDFSTLWENMGEDEWVRTDNLGEMPLYGNGRKLGTTTAYVSDLGAYYIVRDAYRNIKGAYAVGVGSVNAANRGETWYYGLVQDEGGKGVGHALVYNPNTGMIYEINHPSNICDDGPGISGTTSGLSGTQSSGRVISIGYSYDMTTASGRDQFWNFRCGRAQVSLSPVYVPNSQASTAFFESWVGQSWDYGFLTNNCKHYVIQGLQTGGASIINNNCVPANWNYEFTTTWYHP